MKGFILYLLASILWIPLTVINIVIVMIKYINKHGFLKVLDNYFFETAIDIDRFGNRNFRTLWNTILIKHDGIKFEDSQETISSVLGKNQRDKTLSLLGRLLCYILDKIDKDHCQKSIKLTNYY